MTHQLLLDARDHFPRVVFLPRPLSEACFTFPMQDYTPGSGQLQEFLPNISALEG